MPSERRVGNTHGFSLIELVVALAIGTLVVLLAHQVFAVLVEQGRTLIRAREALDRTANARRWLRAAFLSLDVGTDTALVFDGHRDRVTFTTWLLTVDALFARRSVTLAKREDRLIATSAPGDTIVLGSLVDDVAFDYLLEPGADARWVRDWVSPQSAPVAVRLRVRSRRGGAPASQDARVDTLLFLVKERR